MIAHGVTPILNVSNFAESIAWFERLGWEKLWDWGDPPSFGAVGSGKVEIFLCHDGQDGRGKGTNTETFTADDNDCRKRTPLLPEEGWMPLRQTGWWEWVDDVDTIHQHCLANNIEVTMPPRDEPWNVRELHIRHPDGHVFRISRGIECEEE